MGEGMTSAIANLQTKLDSAMGSPEEDRVVFVMVRERGRPVIIAPPRMILDRTAAKVESMLQELPEAIRQPSLEKAIGDGLTAEDGSEDISKGAMFACYMLAISMPTEALNETKYVSVSLDENRVLLVGHGDRDAFVDLVIDQMEQRGMSPLDGETSRTLH